MPKDLTIWMVRAGEAAYLIEDFLKRKVVAIGWDATGNLTRVTQPEEINEGLWKGYPQFTDGQIKFFRSTLQIHAWLLSFFK